MDCLEKVKMLLPTKDDEMTGSLSNDQHLQDLQEEILLKIDDAISTIGDAHLDQSLGKRPKDRVAETHIPWTRFDEEINRGNTVIPLRATADGNCLYNSCSILLTGQESLCHLLRAAVTLELVLNRQYYADHPYIITKTMENTERHEKGIFGLFLSEASDSKYGTGAAPGKTDRICCVANEAVINIKNRTWCSMLSLIALSSVVKRSIRSVYPASSDLHERISNGVVLPRKNTDSNKPISIMWSRTESVNELGSAKFRSNHFVPLYMYHRKVEVLLDTDETLEKPSKIMKLDGKGVESLKPKKNPSTRTKTKSHSLLSMFPVVSKESEITPQLPVATTSTELVDQTTKTNTVLEKIPAAFKIVDISDYIGNIHSLKPTEKVKLAEDIWRPHPKHDFPKSVCGTRTESCKIEWLKKYDWLVYSPQRDALFCLPCLLVSDDRSCKSDTNLIGEGLKYWRSASTKLKAHDTKHKSKLVQYTQLVDLVKNPFKAIDVSMNALEASQIRQNRKRIIPILACVEHLGKSNIAFRGHRDDSKYYLDDNSDNNVGNFQNTLKLVLRFASDELKILIHQAPKNATYRSKTIQNQIINVMGEYVINKIVTDIKKTKIFSVLADEASDVSDQEQMALVLRFMNDKNEIKEKFVSFLHCKNGTSGEALAKMIEDGVHNIGLSFQDVRGQGYDGAGAMAGAVRGVATRIKSKYPLAHFVHCYSHRLNLCVVKITKVDQVKEMFENSRIISEFFSNSPKRMDFFKIFLLESTLTESEKKKLLNVCRTRWVERIEGLFRLVQCYVPVHRAMRVIGSSSPSQRREEAFHNVPWDVNSKVKADGLRHKMEDFSFLVTLVIVKSLLSYLSAITTALQDSTKSIVESYESVANTIETLNGVKLNIEYYHKLWFTTAVELARSIGINPKCPRITQRSIYRSNIPGDNENAEETYFRRNVTVPCLDEMLSELRERFSSDNIALVKGFYCIPSIMTRNSSWKQKLKSFMIRYESDMVDVNTFDAEIDTWETQWLKTSTDLPSTVEETITRMPISMYPNIFQVLHLLAVLPVTTCSCERSISTLRRVKTYLRNTMTQERFNGLALMHIHNEIKFDYEEIIDRLAVKYPKRLKMVNMLDGD